MFFVIYKGILINFLSFPETYKDPWLAKNPLFILIDSEDLLIFYCDTAILFL